MHFLALTENKSSASFLSRGLKYENIPCHPLSLFDNWSDPINISKYDAMICKLEPRFKLNKDLIHKLQIASRIKPVFLLADKKMIAELASELCLPVYIYPHSTSLRILAYEIKKHLASKMNKNKYRTLKVNDLELNINTREVKRFDKKYYLRNKEFQLLEFLMKNPNTVFSRQEILEHVWDRNANLFTHTVDVHINNLRKKIDYKSDCKLIETIYCLGYQINSDSK